MKPTFAQGAESSASHQQRIRVVLFDWGGVIQRTEDPSVRHELDAELGLSPGSVERAVFESESWMRASLGEDSADKAWGAIVGALGYPMARIDDFVTQFFGGDSVDDRLVQLVRQLRARGIRVGLLSNAIPDRSNGSCAADHWGMDGLFDAQVFSYRVGCLKPDPRTYRAALASLRAVAAETLFIDDSPENVVGARRLGMRSVRFCSTVALFDALCAYGLPLSSGDCQRL